MMNLKKAVTQSTLALCCCAGFSTEAEASKYFPDVAEDAVYADAVDFLFEIGLSSGDQGGYFNPDDTLTRGEFATMMCKFILDYEVDFPSTPTFSDVPEHHWAYTYAEAANQMGLMAGVGDGSFGVDSKLTLQEAATVLVNMMGDEARNLAVEYGGYPYGFLQVVEEVGGMENIRSGPSDDFPRKEMALLMSNLSYFDINDLMRTFSGYWDSSVNQGRTQNIEILVIQEDDDGFYVNFAYAYSESMFGGTASMDQVKGLGGYIFEIPVTDGDGKTEVIKFDFSNYNYDVLVVDDTPYLYMGPTDEDYFDYVNHYYFK